MTRKEKAVAIAKDVIKQVRLKRFKATQGEYVGLDVWLDMADPKSQLQCVITDAKCEVCARGAMFVSSVRLFNKFKVGDFSYNDFMMPGSSAIGKYELLYLTDKQRALLECTFEAGVYNSVVPLSPDEELAAMNYSDSFTDSESRLIGLMRNIIRNKGNFVIPKKFTK